MKAIVLTFLISLALTKTVEKHYHYHIDGLSPEAQRELMQLDPNHKGFMSNVWCFVKNPFNKQKRLNCIETANAKENNQAPTDSKTTSKRLLSSETDMLFKKFEHKLTWKQFKCHSLYFWSKSKRQTCLGNTKRRLAAEIASFGSPKHEGFFGKLKCLFKHAFNKSKREECYKQVNEEEERKKSETKTEITTEVKAAKRRLSTEHKHIIDTTGCFFRYMFNSKKRADCNAKAKSKREAAKKASEEKKAAAKKAEAEAKASAERDEMMVGLNAKGKKKVLSSGHRKGIHRHFHF